jgi:hypothetical protein
MGAQVAVHGKQPPGFINLQHFAQEIVVKLELKPLREVTRWVIFGRVLVDNFDGDSQDVTARIVHDANVVIDYINIYADGKTRNCLAVQATLETPMTTRAVTSLAVPAPSGTTTVMFREGHS